MSAHTLHLGEGTSMDPHVCHLTPFITKLPQKPLSPLPPVAYRVLRLPPPASLSSSSSSLQPLAALLCCQTQPSSPGQWFPLLGTLVRPLPRGGPSRASS